MKNVWLINFEYSGKKELSHLVTATMPNQNDIVELVKLGCKDHYGRLGDVTINKSNVSKDRVIYDLYDKANNERIIVDVLLMEVVNLE